MYSTKTFSPVVRSIDNAYAPFVCTRRVHNNSRLGTARSFSLAMVRLFLYGNSDINLRHPFSRVTPEPGLQFHANLKVGLRHVLGTSFPEEHGLRLLRKSFFPGRYWAVSHEKTAFLSRSSTRFTALRNLLILLIFWPKTNRKKYRYRIRGTAQEGRFFVRDGSVTPREEGFTKQTQVVLLRGWCAEDVA